MPVAATEKDALWPAFTVWFAGCVVIDGAAWAAMPVPASETEMLEDAPYLNVSLPVNDLAASGKNATYTTRL